MHKTDRHLIRQFLDKADWCSVQAMAVLLFGNKDKISVSVANTELTCMAKLKTGSIKKLPCPYAMVYANAQTKRKRLGTSFFDHDNKTREVVAKYIHDKGTHLIEGLHFHPPSDACIGSLFFELDNGHMTEKQLKEKINRYYIKPGGFQVIFIMASPYRHLHPRIKEHLGIFLRLLSGA